MWVLKKKKQKNDKILVYTLKCILCARHVLRSTEIPQSARVQNGRTGMCLADAPPTLRPTNCIKMGQNLTHIS